MCRSNNYNYALQAPIDASAIGVPSSDIVQSLTSSLSTALQDVNKLNNANNNPSTEHSSNSISRNNNHKHNARHPHIVVEHHYHDHANDDEYIDERPARGGVTTPFPIRLHKMLDKMEADGHGDVISWQPHGRCFVVRKPKEFKDLLPTYFKLSKMASFQRQLNLYGFQRLTRGRDKNGYYHEFFLRGKPALSHKIQRTKVKGTGVRARSSPATEPHLWEMAWVGTTLEQQQAAAAEAAANHVSDAGSVSTQEDETDFNTPEPSPAPTPKKQAAMAHPPPMAVIHTMTTEESYVTGSLPQAPSLSSDSSATISTRTAAASACMPPLVTPTWSAQPKIYSSQSHQHQQHHPVAQAGGGQLGGCAGMLSQQQQQQWLLFQQQQQQARDEICLFGKTFHYLDPREMMEEAELRKKQLEACQKRADQDTMHAFMSNTELDNLYTELDDEGMDNDDAFMDMLERVIE